MLRILTEIPSTRSLSSFFVKEEQHGRETNWQILSDSVFPVQQIFILDNKVQSYDLSCI